MKWRDFLTPFSSDIRNSLFLQMDPQAEQKSVAGTGPLSRAYLDALRLVVKQKVRTSQIDERLAKRQPPNYALNRGAYREALNFSVVIDHPEETDRVTTLCAKRNLVIQQYFDKESILFDEGDCKGLTTISKVWDKIKTPKGHVHSNYGHMVFHTKDVGSREFEPDRPLVSGWEWAKERLLLCDDTNQAVIVFLRPCHQYETNLDQPCTTNIQFLMRDGELHLFSNMRSNDIVYGTPYNLMYFVRLLHRMVRELKERKYKDLKPGNIYHHVTSLHMYEKHKCVVESMLGRTSDDSIWIV